MAMPESTVFGMKAVKGAAATLYAATDPDATQHIDIGGRLDCWKRVDGRGRRRSHRGQPMQEMARQLWEHTEALTGIKFQL